MFKQSIDHVWEEEIIFVALINTMGISNTLILFNQ
jgi:hypothetical protein